MSGYGQKSICNSFYRENKTHNLSLLGEEHGNLSLLAPESQKFDQLLPSSQAGKLARVVLALRLKAIGFPRERDKEREA
jgi:hypothetical protein